jgi:hypothetical protein
MKSVFLVYILNDRNNHKQIQCFIFKDLSFSRKSVFAVKITDVNNDVCKIHSDFRSGAICFISFLQEIILILKYFICLESI